MSKPKTSTSEKENLDKVKQSLRAKQSALKPSTTKVKPVETKSTASKPNQVKKVSKKTFDSFQSPEQSKVIKESLVATQEFNNIVLEEQQWELNNNLAANLKNDLSNQFSETDKTKKHFIHSSYSCWGPRFKHKIDETKTKVFLLMSDDFFLAEKIMSTFVFSLGDVLGLSLIPAYTTAEYSPQTPSVLADIPNKILHDKEEFSKYPFAGNVYSIPVKLKTKTTYFHYFHSNHILNTWTQSPSSTVVTAFSWKEFEDFKTFFSEFDDIELVTIYLSKNNFIDKDYKKLYQYVDYSIVSKKEEKAISFFLNIISLYYPLSLKELAANYTTDILNKITDEYAKTDYYAKKQKEIQEKIDLLKTFN